MAEIDRAYMQLKMRLQQDRHPEGTLLAELDAFKSKVDASLAAAEAARKSVGQWNRKLQESLQWRAEELADEKQCRVSSQAAYDKEREARIAAEARAVKAEGELDQSRTAWRAMKERWIEAGEERDAAIAQVGEEARKRGLVEAERDDALRKLAELEAMIPPRPEDAERLIWMMKPVVVEPFPVVDDAAKEGDHVESCPRHLWQSGDPDPQPRCTCKEGE